MRSAIALLLFLHVLFFPRSGSAQPNPPKRVIVVAVAADAPELDATQVRAAVGRELQCDVAGPDDERAADADGRIDVSVDRSARQLVVSYNGGAEPLVRHVDLPGDREATTRIVALLAGNLGRDEADDLAASLRRRAPPQAPEPPPSASDEREAAADNRLRRLLADYAAHDRTVRRATGWGLIAGAVAAGGVSVYLTVRGSTLRDDEASGVAPEFTGLAGALGLLGGLSLALPSAFEKLSEADEAKDALGHRAARLREEVERQWRREADSARRFRIGYGVVATVLGAGLGGFDAWLLVSHQGPQSKAIAIDGAINVAGAAASVGLGVVLLTTKSNVESRLEQYQRGEDLHRTELRDVRLQLAPVSGGAEIGLTGHF